MKKIIYMKHIYINLEKVKNNLYNNYNTYDFN